MSAEVRNSALGVFNALGQLESGQIASGTYLDRQPVVEVETVDILGGQRRVVRKVGEEISLVAVWEGASELAEDSSARLVVVKQHSAKRGEGELRVEYDTASPLVLPIRFGGKNLDLVEKVLSNLEITAQAALKRGLLVKGAPVTTKEVT